MKPYEDIDVITGQATCFYEMIDQVDETLDFVVCPVGGGGMIAGTALSANYFSKSTKVIGAEPSKKSDGFLSFKTQTLIQNNNAQTICDGLRVPIGAQNMSFIKEYVEDILLVDEKETINAFFLLISRLKIIIEPASAVSIAAILKNPERFKGKSVGVLLTGGNVDLMDTKTSFGKLE